MTSSTEPEIQNLVNLVLKNVLLYNNNLTTYSIYLIQINIHLTKNSRKKFVLLLKCSVINDKKKMIGDNLISRINNQDGQFAMCYIKI